MPDSWTVEHHGIVVRLFRRGRSGTIYRALRVGRVTSSGGHQRTRQDIRSLGHSDRARAEEQARELCDLLKLAQLAPDTQENPLTMSDLVAAYQRHRGRLLTRVRLQEVSRILELFKRHVGPSFRVSALGQHDVDTYVHARRAGELRPESYRSREHISAGTARNEVHILSTVMNWATKFRTDGRPILASNPLHGVVVPLEMNPRRPRVSPERYHKLVAVADQVDPSGQLGLLLALAWTTGRRVNALLHLTAADVLLDRASLVAAFADAGQDDAIAAEWSGGLRWRAAWDKKGYETFSPLPAALRPHLASYMRDHGVIAGAWLFDAGKGEPMNKGRAGYLLSRAERAAGLPRVTRGGWHAFRRGWAQRRKSMPVADVMAAGGWRDSAALRTAYQGADSRTMMDVVDLPEGGRRRTRGAQSKAK
jgi:integrase